MSCPDDACSGWTWYDARYEKDDTVSVWVVSKLFSAYLLLEQADATLTNGAADMFTQASAAIALCILSLNLF